MKKSATSPLTSDNLDLRPVSMSAAEASYLALPIADRARIEEFVDDPSTAVKRTYKRRQ